MDVDMTKGVNIWKCTLGYITLLQRKDMSWEFRLQKYFALSMVKVKYIIMIEVCKEILQMKEFMRIKIDVEVACSYL